MKDTLEIIETVLLWGSITKSAKEIGISQPGLTSWINNLEKKVGYTLFDRSTGPIVLTEEGKCYREFLKNSRVLENEFKSKIDEIYNKNKRLIIGAPSIYIRAVLVDLVARLKEKNSNRYIEIIESTVPDFEKKLEYGEIDMFISTSNSNSKFCYEQILEEEILVCVPKGSRIDKCLNYYTARTDKNVSFFNNEEFIMLMDNQPLQIKVNKFLDENKLHIKKTLSVNQVPVAVELASKLNCSCFASACAIKKLNEEKNMNFYSLSDVIDNRKIYLAYDGTYKSDSVDEVISVLKEKKI